jgi:GNAT superfamily N-acetyltransferase
LPIVTIAPVVTPPIYPRAVLRPRRDEDAPGIATVIRETAPGWVASEEGVRHRFAHTQPRSRRADWIAEVDGEVAGWGSAALEIDIDRDDVAWVHVAVRPAWRGRGLGGALYAEAERHAREIGANRLRTTSEEDEASRAFAADRGFRHTMTARLSSVDPRSVDPAELERLAADKAAEGFELVPFAAFDDRPELIHAVDAEATLDEPSDEQVTDMRFDEWLDRFWGHPDMTHEGSFAVVHDGEPVALAELIVDLEGLRAGNGFTGTRRAYRGRGLARLAKLASVAWLAERGVTRLVTANDETNAPMLAVNTRLGYEPFAEQLSWIKDYE